MDFQLAGFSTIPVKSSRIQVNSSKHPVNSSKHPVNSGKHPVILKIQLFENPVGPLCEPKDAGLVSVGPVGLRRVSVRSISGPFRYVCWEAATPKTSRQGGGLLPPRPRADYEGRCPSNSSERSGFVSQSIHSVFLQNGHCNHSWYGRM